MSRNMRFLVLLTPLLVAAGSYEARRQSTKIIREAEEAYADRFWEIVLDQYL